MVMEMMRPELLCRDAEITVVPEKETLDGELGIEPEEPKGRLVGGLAAARPNGAVEQAAGKDGEPEPGCRASSPPSPEACCRDVRVGEVRMSGEQVVEERRAGPWGPDDEQRTVLAHWTGLRATQ